MSFKKGNKQTNSNVEVVEAEPVVIDGEKWIPQQDPEFPQSHDFNTTPIFTGVYERPYEFESGDVHIKGHIFKDLQGFKTLVYSAYQIDKAVEKNGNIKYRIEYKGKKDLKGGRSVKEFNILVSNNVNL